MLNFKEWAKMKWFIIITAFLSVNFVSIQGQLVQCFSGTSCGGSSTMTTPRECCVDTAGATSFTDSADNNMCKSCIVFGFIETTLRRPERGQGYELQVGYLKVPVSEDAPALPLTVTEVLGTASTSDFTLQTRLTVLFVNQARRDVTFTFHVDAIAQEEDETVTLQLSVPVNVLEVYLDELDNSVFFFDSANLIIVDSDALELIFTEEDYRSAEPELSMPVRVNKNNRIATPVTVRVTPRVMMPMTVTPPGEVLSPIEADLQDFDNTPIVVTFLPDETAPVPVNDINTPVRIVNDTVNEAEEQTFEVHLSLVSAANEDNITIVREVALCRIIDDDEISIGFELPQYSFLEPESGQENIFDTIFLVKENNVTSEQTFRIAVTVTVNTPDQSIQSAEIGIDFAVNIQADLLITIEPSKQQVPFNIRLFADDQAEGTEAFQASTAAHEDSPNFLPPSVLSPNTFIIIEDSDIVVIGFELPSYTVFESDGFAEVCAIIYSPPRVFFDIILSVDTFPGTADPEEDYETILAEGALVFLQFSDNMRRDCFNVTIIPDSDFETPETFSIELVFSPFVPEPSGVTLEPNVTIVEIIEARAPSLPVNDTIVGDPLLTVPLFITNKTLIPDISPDEPVNLCYEVRAEQDMVYNLVSDMCVTVNAQYAQVAPNERLNIINAVYVRAVDSEGYCHNIAVDLDQCTPSVNLTEVQMLNTNGVYVRKIRNRVRIAVPNCRDQDLVMWVFCQNTMLQSTVIEDTMIQAEMIRFVISRGFSLQESSHGILGQFWNVPIDIERYVGTEVDGADPGPNAYTITVNYPGGPPRVFVGWLYPITWEKRVEYCLYAGNSQGGRSVEIPAPFNDPVVEGEYTEYMVGSPFDSQFVYNHFEEGQCN